MRTSLLPPFTCLLSIVLSLEILVEAFYEGLNGLNAEECRFEHGRAFAKTENSKKEAGETRSCVFEELHARSLSLPRTPISALCSSQRVPDVDGEPPPAKGGRRFAPD